METTPLRIQALTLRLARRAQPRRVPQVGQDLCPGREPLRNEFLCFGRGIAAFPTRRLFHCVELVDIRIRLEEILHNVRKWILEPLRGLNKRAEIIRLNSSPDKLALESSVQRFSRRKVGVSAASPAIVMNSGMQRLRAVRYIMAEDPSVIDYILFDLLALGGSLRIAP